jgi:transmembrane sensor
VSSDSDRLHTEVSIWLARLERGLQQQDGARLREWLQVAAQREAIVEAAKLYHGPDIIAILAEMVPVGFGHPSPKPRRRFRPFHVATAVGAGLLVAAVPILIALGTLPAVLGPLPRHVPERPLDPPLPWGEEAYATKAGETRSVNLLDGSKLALNSHTRVGVLFGGGARLATVQYGEAVFEIDGKRERPFQIDADGRHFLAPQAKFDVRIINPRTVELTVLQGRVTVQGLPWSWPTTPDEARMFDPQVFADTTVEPLQAVWLQDKYMARFPVTAANAQARLSWQPEEVLYITP